MGRFTLIKSLRDLKLQIILRYENEDNCEIVNITRSREFELERICDVYEQLHMIYAVQSKTLKKYTFESQLQSCEKDHNGTFLSLLDKLIIIIKETIPDNESRYHNDRCNGCYFKSHGRLYCNDCMSNCNYKCNNCGKSLKLYRKYCGACN